MIIINVLPLYQIATLLLSTSHHLHPILNYYQFAITPTVICLD